MKNSALAVFIVTACLFSFNAMAADSDNTPVLNRIFKIDTAKKDKNAKGKTKQGPAPEKPMLNDFFGIDKSAGNGNGPEGPEEALTKENERLYVELGDTYTKSKMYKQAMEAYENALRIDSDNPDAHFNLGLLYQHYLGDTEKAIYHLKKYLKVAPSPKKADEAKYYLGIMRQDRDWEVIKQ